MTDIGLQQAAAAAYQEAKPFLTSRTIWALLVTVAAWTANRAGAHIGDPQIQSVVDLVTTVVQGGSISAAALFRVMATKPLT